MPETKCSNSDCHPQIHMHSGRWRPYGMAWRRCVLKMEDRWEDFMLRCDCHFLQMTKIDITLFMKPIKVIIENSCNTTWICGRIQTQPVNRPYYLDRTFVTDLYSWLTGTGVLLIPAQMFVMQQYAVFTACVSCVAGAFDPKDCTTYIISVIQISYPRGGRCFAVLCVLAYYCRWHVTFIFFLIEYSHTSTYIRFPGIRLLMNSWYSMPDV